MHSAPISSGYRSEIRNDYKNLDRFTGKLAELQLDLQTVAKQMIQRLEDLNRDGFADSNFKNLYDVLTGNTENIEKICSVMEKLQQHIEGLSLLIKKYYNVEI
ncbi:hypothetical protein [Chryseobacterium sp. SL1]|uniref:hypothetical protein n=1 Tax=Chryseobacterium sp. SL1 TaxID=2995159 RepID=UPI0022736F4E|nr:hypothetical protein [Chryseobacterium sp. SL1]MCY1660920.1 hypothetical protein [Chryseobacterium sp. SL1]